MGIAILDGYVDNEKSAACFVCTTSGQAFGPLLDDHLHGEVVLEACTMLGADPRLLNDDTLGCPSGRLAQLMRAVRTVELTDDSHRDHGVGIGVTVHLLAAAAEERAKDTRGPNATTIVTVELPEVLGTVPCALVGPIMGDPPVTDAFMRRRPGREGDSRMVRAPLRDVRTATIIAGQHAGRVIMYTAFGGPLAPREPWDPALTTDDARETSAAFWAVHALATGVR
jgi:hypothetical protein